MRLARSVGAPLALLLLAVTAACGGDDAETASPFADCAGLTKPPPSAALLPTPSASPAAMTGASGSAAVAGAVTDAVAMARHATTIAATVTLASAATPATVTLASAVTPATVTPILATAIPAAATPADVSEAAATVGTGTEAGASAATPLLAITPSGPAGAAQLPDLRLPCFTGGEEVALRDVRGPAVVNLWASWCEPCRTELPVMQQLADKAAGRLTVVGVDVGDKKEKGASFATDAGVTMPTLFDADQQLLRALGRINLPITVFLDASGRSYVHLLPLDAPGLAQQVRKHTGVAVAG